MPSRSFQFSSQWRRGASVLLWALHFSCVMLAAWDDQDHVASSMRLSPLEHKPALVRHSSAWRGCLSLRGGLLVTSRPSDVALSETTVGAEGSTFVDVCNDVSLCRDALPLVKASEHLSSEPGNQTVPPNSEVRIRMEPTTYNLTCEGDLPIIRRMLLYGTKKPEKNASTLIGSAQIDEQHISGGGRFKFLEGSAGSILQGVSLQYSLLHCVIISKSGVYYC